MKNSTDLVDFNWKPSLLDLQNSSYPTQPHSLIVKYLMIYVLTPGDRLMKHVFIVRGRS